MLLPPRMPRQRQIRAYSTCYTRVMSSGLAEAARHADALLAQGRAELVRAVREAAAAGKTQAQIAAEIGRSQPEVSRLLRFHGTSPLGRRLRKHAAEVRRLVAEAGGRNVRVFGSVATGEDRKGSDIDLLFTMGRPLSLMQLGALEHAVSQAVECPVDLVPDTVLRPEFRDRVLAEAVAL
jgi:predicted nucleotidyltransferase